MSGKKPGGRGRRGVARSRRRTSSCLSDLDRLSVRTGDNPDRDATRPVPVHGGRIIGVCDNEIGLHRLPRLMVIVRRRVRMGRGCRVGVGERLTRGKTLIENATDECV